MLEKDLQKSIIEYLSYRKDVYFVRNNSFAGNFLRKDGSKGYIKNNKAGSPDILICYRGEFIGCEIKNEKGKMSELQEEAKKSLEEAGGRYIIVRSINDVIDLLKI